MEAQIPKDLSGKVIVITGASSGIGRATAIELGKHGATVAIAARREKYLLDTAKEVEPAGGTCFIKKTDVSDYLQMQELYKATLNKFGKIDAWVNNAGAIAFGGIATLPVNITERIINVNLFGCIYGMKTIVPHFIQQGHGLVINVSSMVGVLAQPYSAAYTAAKFGIRGYTEAAQMELLNTKVKVCLVMPACIDTPLFHHAANYTGKEIRISRPVYETKIAAKAIVDLFFRPQPEITIGMPANILLSKYAMFPSAIRSIFTQREKWQNNLKPAPVTDGNLFEPMDDGMKESGGWRDILKEKSKL